MFSSKMFNQVQVWAQVWPLKAIHRVILTPVLWYLGSVIVFLLEDEPFLRGPDRSGTDYYQESPCTLLHSSLIPAAEKHPHRMMLPSPCFTGGMVLAR